MDDTGIDAPALRRTRLKRANSVYERLFQDPVMENPVCQSRTAPLDPLLELPFATIVPFLRLMAVIIEKFMQAIFPAKSMIPMIGQWTR